MQNITKLAVLLSLFALGGGSCPDTPPSGPGGPSGFEDPRPRRKDEPKKDDLKPIEDLAAKNIIYKGLKDYRNSKANLKSAIQNKSREATEALIFYLNDAIYENKDVFEELSKRDLTGFEPQLLQVQETVPSYSKKYPLDLLIGLKSKASTEALVQLFLSDKYLDSDIDDKLSRELVARKLDLALYAANLKAAALGDNSAPRVRKLLSAMDGEASTGLLLTFSDACTYPKFVASYESDAFLKVLEKRNVRAHKGFLGLATTIVKCPKVDDRITKFTSDELMAIGTLDALSIVLEGKIDEAKEKDLSKALVAIAAQSNGDKAAVENKLAPFLVDANSNKQKLAFSVFSDVAPSDVRVIQALPAILRAHMYCTGVGIGYEQIEIYAKQKLEAISADLVAIMSERDDCVQAYAARLVATIKTPAATAALIKYVKTGDFSKVDHKHKGSFSQAIFAALDSQDLTSEVKSLSGLMSVCDKFDQQEKCDRLVSILLKIKGDDSTHGLITYISLRRNFDDAMLTRLYDELSTRRNDLEKNIPLLAQIVEANKSFQSTNLAARLLAKSGSAKMVAPLVNYVQKAEMPNEEVRHEIYAGVSVHGTAELAHFVPQLVQVIEQKDADGPAGSIYSNKKRDIAGDLLTLVNTPESTAGLIDYIEKRSGQFNGLSGRVVAELFDHRDIAPFVAKLKSIAGTAEYDNAKIAIMLLKSRKVPGTLDLTIGLVKRAPYLISPQEEQTGLIMEVVSQVWDDTALMDETVVKLTGVTNQAANGIRNMINQVKLENILGNIQRNIASMNAWIRPAAKGTNP